MAEALRVALVHDWLTNQGGGERVLWALHRAFPEAPIYTSVFKPSALPQFAKLDVRTSFLQGWPLAKTKHQLYPVLRTWAFESFDFSDYDVVISSSSAESKGVVTPAATMQIAYIHTPVRYYWSDYQSYMRSPGFGLLNGLVRLVAPRLIRKMREWDFAAAQRPDYLIANSKVVQRRIEKYYRRPSEVIHPPIDASRFRVGTGQRDYFLVLSRLIPYKRADLAVVATKELDLPLVVAGSGGELGRLKSLAGPKTKFIHGPTDEEVSELMAGAKALIFAAEEDFGLVPLEAMAAGTPVIAYGRGGALETVIPGKTGLFFSEQTVVSLLSALRKFDSSKYDPAMLRSHAEKFDEAVFIRQMQQFVTDKNREFTS